MKKKLLCAFLSICILCLSISSFCLAYAQNEAEIVSEKVVYDGSGQIKISVKITGNTGIVALKTKVSFDKNVLTLVDVEDKGLLSGKKDTDETQNPFTLRWADSFAERNNSANGTAAVLTFDVVPGFYGETSISISVVEAVKLAASTELVLTDFGNGTVKMTNAEAGDADGDESITDWDSIVMKRYLANWGADILETAADIDGDGEITDWDSVLLARYLAGWTDTLGSSN